MASAATETALADERTPAGTAKSREDARRDWADFTVLLEALGEYRDCLRLACVNLPGIQRDALGAIAARARALAAGAAPATLRAFAEHFDRDGALELLAPYATLRHAGAEFALLGVCRAPKGGESPLPEQRFVCRWAPGEGVRAAVVHGQCVALDLAGGTFRALGGGPAHAGPALRAWGPGGAHLFEPATLARLGW